MSKTQHLTLRTMAVTTALLAATLAGCATQSTSGAVYREGETRRAQMIEQGVVESVRNVTIQGDTNNVGTLAGGVLGGMAGSNIGGGSGRAAGAILGAVAGGIAGQAVERNASNRAGLEITVRMDNGTLRAYVQDADEQFRPGERVRIVSSGGVARVTR
ncbi:MAG: glycine zipper 2TM domain-containing protein [Limnobacter sp.]|uniref:glycine zipper 2TM domain-containing protein n=1 Tax=Limnobacter sp. TaxID=2003368 RepID=UPI00391BE992